MSALHLHLPDSLAQRVQRLARLDGVSVNEYIALAVAEKAALDEANETDAEEQLRYLRARASRAEEDPRAVIHELLAKAPDTEPPPEDRLPE